MSEATHQITLMMDNSEIQVFLCFVYTHFQFQYIKGVPQISTNFMTQNGKVTHARFKVGKPHFIITIFTKTTFV